MTDTKSTSQILKKTNFHQEFVMPTIYDIDNIKLIQLCAFHETPKNKVFETKKKNLSEYISKILQKTNHKAASSKKQSHVKVRPKTAFTISKRSSNPELEFEGEVKNDDLFMDIDEDLGEMGKIIEEDHAPLADRVSNIFNKVKKMNVHRSSKELKKKVNGYIQEISPLKKANTIDKNLLKKSDGLLKEIHDLEKNGYKKKQRAQSAKYISKKIPISQSLTGSKKLDSQNFKKISKNQNQKSKGQNLIKKIDKQIKNENQKNQQLNVIFKKMKKEWVNEGSIAKTYERTKNVQIVNEVLEGIRVKRSRQLALAGIDADIFK